MNTTLRNKTALVLAVMGVAACASYDKDVADTPVHEVQTGSVAAQQTSQEYRDHDVEEEESDLPDDVAPPSAPAGPASLAVATGPSAGRTFQAIEGAGSLLQVLANGVGWRAENLKMEAQERNRDLRL